MNDHPLLNFRPDGPATAALAGEEHETLGASARQRRRCLECVTAYPGSTAGEVQAATGILAHKRLPELRKLGLVRNGDDRRCRITGKLAMTWWAV